MEYVDKISKAKCEEIVENIMMGCEEGEIRNIIHMLAEPLGIKLLDEFDMKSSDLLRKMVVE